MPRRDLAIFREMGSRSAQPERMAIEQKPISINGKSLKTKPDTIIINRCALIFRGYISEVVKIRIPWHQSFGSSWGSRQL